MIANVISSILAPVTPSTLTIDYLVVAGGGGGGVRTAGGGGAGGLRCTVTATGGGGTLESSLTLSLATNYSITVGGGGAGAVSHNAQGTTGTINTGGGAGGSGYNNMNGVNGGSGIVIVKIINTTTATFSGGVAHGNVSPWTNGSPITSVSGYKIYVISAAGVSDTVTFS